MLPILGSDNVSVAFLFDGCNCWRIWQRALGRFSNDLLDELNDRAPNLRVFDSSVCPYQGDPVGCREKSTYVARYRRPTLWALREMQLTRRPLKEERYRHTKDVGQMLETAGTDAVGALLVFLHLLEGQSQTIRQLRLTEVEHKSTHADAATNMVVYRVTPLIHCCPLDVDRAGLGANVSTTSASMRRLTTLGGELRPRLLGSRLLVAGLFCRKVAPSKAAKLLHRSLPEAVPAVIFEATAPARWGLGSARISLERDVSRKTTRD
jgi:hypothetical protein